MAGSFDGVGTDYPYVSHIIPKLLQSMHNKTPITIAGDDFDTPDGTCIRDYVHVADIARAHIIAAEKMVAGEQLNTPINLSSGNGYSVKEVAETFNKVTGADLPIEVGPRRGGDPAKRDLANGVGLQGDGASRHRAARLPALLLSPPARPRTHQEGQPQMRRVH